MVSRDLLVKDLLVKPKQLTTTKVSNENRGNGSAHFISNPKIMLLNTVENTSYKTLRYPSIVHT